VNKLKNCPDCYVEPGEVHLDGCDIERCSSCARQKMVCDCKDHDKSFARWTGIWPGVAEAEYLGIGLNDFYTKKYTTIFFKKPKE
jgi:hypothetical protein